MFIILSVVVIVFFGLMYYKRVYISNTTKKNKIMPLDYIPKIHLPPPENVKYYNSNDLKLNGVRLLDINNFSNISLRDHNVSEHSSRDHNVSENSTIEPSLSDISLSDHSQINSQGNIIPFTEAIKTHSDDNNFSLIENDSNTINTFRPFVDIENGSNTLVDSDISSENNTEYSFNTSQLCITEDDDYSYEYRKAESIVNADKLRIMMSHNGLISDIQTKTNLSLSELVDVYVST